ncbi:MAG: T9SS type A sorting domain-containing protein, partial [candidate division Zixibacteria bacterium]
LGWPRTLPGRGAQSPICADLNNDSIVELIVGTGAGLYVFHGDGTIAEGFPVRQQTDMRCIPAIYDVDGDGSNEIIATSADGLHVFNHDGSYADGWPVACYTGYLNFGFPTPSVIELGGMNRDTAIVLINNRGEVLAYHLNGNPHFYSLEGWFADFDSKQEVSFFYGGNSVSSADFDGDGILEVAAPYSLNSPWAGTALFNGRTGQPAWDRPNARVITATVIYGSSIVDLDGDNLPEIVAVGYDSLENRTVWVRTFAGEDLPGWPVVLPEVYRWLGTVPTIADLDLDGSPEILMTFFEFDISALYILNADGSPHLIREGRPAGEVFFQAVTFGTPMVADLLGDERPEIVMRSGYVFPGTGTEKLWILDNEGYLMPGWPTATPNRPATVFSTQFAPMVDDVDGDGLVEVALISDNNDLYVWDFSASSDNGNNRARLNYDDINSNHPNIKGSSTGVDDPDANLPAGFVLGQNYPNPFNPGTKIQFDLPSKGDVKLEVFNILGRRVAVLVDAPKNAGRHTVEFDASNLSSGLYLYRLRHDKNQMSRKMILLR